MAKLRRARRQSLSIVAVGLLATAGFLMYSSIGARASHPPSVTAEQHWDLLSETADDLTSGAGFVIERGVLPGGTTKFSPQPTATFQVVGRYQSGVSGTTYRVDLRSDFTTVASVTFTNSDSGWTRRNASITWPSSDVELDEIQVVKSGSGGGNFDLHKASIALSQQGVIKKTVARVPMAAKFLNVTDTQARLVDVPAFYEHVAADFSPAPTIKLRATGAGNQATEFHVELWKAGDTNPISGSDLSFTSNAITSKETAALSLPNGTYEVRVKIVDLGPVGEVIEPNEPGLYSVDLVLDQSTADTHGLTCAVGIYTGISAAVNLNTGNNGQDQGFAIKGPNINVPSLTTDWQWSAKRTSTSGSVGVNFANVSRTPPPVTNVTPVSVSTYSLKTASIPSTPTNNENVESRSKVDGSSTTGIASMSRLRYGLCLRDLALPTVSGFDITSNPVFSPASGSTKPTTSFGAQISDNFSYPVTWLYDIRPQGSQTVIRTYSGSIASGTSTISRSWNGHEGSDTGPIAADGTYEVVLKATDAAGNLLSQIKTVILDKTVPVLGTLSANNMFFSPTGDGIKESTTVSLDTLNDANGPLSWRFTIMAGGSEVKTWPDSQASSVSQPWFGTNNAGSVVDDATYSAVLKVTDAASNFAEKTLTGIVVDKVKPTITGYQRTNASISPNGDGNKDATTLSVTTLYDLNGLSGWTLPIENGAYNARTFTGTGTSFSVTWNGRKDTDLGPIVPDATYSATLKVTDLAGNFETQLLTIVKDLTAPVIGTVSALPSPFSPNVPPDGTKDTSTISTTLSDATPPLTWTVVIKQGGTTVRSFPQGSGTAVSAAWDGKNNAGNPVGDGTYQAFVTATDDHGLTLTSPARDLIVDTLGATISGLAPTNTHFSPNGDNVKEDTTINASLSDPAGISNWKLTVRDSTNGLVDEWQDSSSVVAKLWNGKYQNQQIVDGAYTATLSVTDGVGNIATGVVNLVIDRVKPVISGLGASPPSFSPNGDNNKETTTISASITDSSPIDWSIPISNGGPAVRTLTGSGTPIAAEWDGRNTGGTPLGDGTYSATLTVTDRAGNAETPAALSIRLDKTIPQIATLAALTPFSPNNPPDGVKDTTTISTSITDASALTWTLVIRQGGADVRNFSQGSGSSVSLTWDGKNNGSQPVTDGSYDAVLTATDEAGMSASATKTLVVDILAPAISGFGATETLFSPNNPPDGTKDNTTIAASLSDLNGPISYSLVIKNAGGSPVRTYPADSGTSVSKLWDGKDTSGAYLADGTYSATFTATDAAGNPAVAVPFDLIIDTLAPSVSSLVANPGPFSPNNDGWKDTTTITAGLGEANGAPSWDLVLSGALNLPTFSGTGTSVSALWDGKDASSGGLSSGTYTATLDARDLAGNLRSVPTQVVIDKNAPTISGLSASELFFSPNGDGVKDQTTISASLGDASAPLNWTVVIKQGGTTVRTLPVGTGSSPSVDWDGEDVPDHVVDDGTYSATISVADDQHLSASATIDNIVVDTILPTMTDLAVSEPFFSPNNDNKKETTTFSANLSDLNGPMTWKVAVTNSNNAEVRTLTGNGAALSAEWDGRTQAGEVQPDGTYAATVTGTDPAGNSTLTSLLSISLDNSAPQISGFTTSPSPFSPNGDGVKDELVISTGLIDDNGPVLWRVDLKDDDVIERTFSGSGAEVSQTWNGTDLHNDRLADGTYTVSIQATDPADNIGSVNREVILDVKPPSITSVFPPSGTNTAHVEGQPIAVDVGDSLAGIALSTFSLQLKDESTGATSELPITWSGNTAKTSPIPLISGHRYRRTVSISDQAGNATTRADQPVSEGGGLLAVTQTTNSTRVRIPRTACDLTTEGAPLGSKFAICSKVAAFMDQGTASLSGSLGKGVGHFIQQFNLGSVRVGTTLPTGTPISLVAEHDPIDPQWADVAVPTRYLVSEGFTDAAISFQVDAQTVELGTLKTQVPAAWSTAFLEMDWSPTVPVSSTCADPSTSTGEECSPDPVAPGLLAWIPPVTVVHIDSCDSALSHKPKTLISPDQPLSLEITADTARITVSMMKLLYTSGGQLQVIQQSGNGSGNYSFVIPASVFSSGTKIQYAFLADGTLHGSCGSAEAAMAPRYFSYVAFAGTANASPERIHGIVGEALLTMSLQPGVDSSSPTAFCAAYFSPPTPCTLFPGGPAEENSVLDMGDSVPVPISADTSASCDRTQWFNEDPSWEQTWYQEGKDDSQSATYGRVDPNFERSKDYWWDPVWGRMNWVTVESLAASVFFEGRSWAEQDGRVGFDWIPVCSDPCDLPPDFVLQFDVELEFSVRGRGKAVANPFLPVICIGPRCVTVPAGQRSALARAWVRGGKVSHHGLWESAVLKDQLAWAAPDVYSTTGENVGPVSEGYDWITWEDQELSRTVQGRRYFAQIEVYAQADTENNTGADAYYDFMERTDDKVWYLRSGLMKITAHNFCF